MPIGVPESYSESGQASCRVLRLTSESKILNYCEPEFPWNIRQVRQERTLYLKADVDHEGRVTDVRFLWSDRSLNEAVAAAVKKWMFEPILVEGKPMESTRAIKIIIRGGGEKAAVTAWRYPHEFRVHELRSTEGAAGRSPKALRQVGPVYPLSPRRQGLEGEIAMEVLFSEHGFAEAVLLWKSVPELEEAAIEAFSQWVYEPLAVNGKPNKFITSFHVHFRVAAARKNEPPIWLDKAFLNR